jgi:Right handed beta helix region
MINLSPAPVLVLSLLCAAYSPAAARTWRVETDGSGDTTLVQGGIGLASPGDTVLVGPGTYNENIDFLGKNIVVRTESGPLVTTLDGSSGNDSVVKFHNGESRAAMIIGFTITGGEGTRDFGSPSGGGIKVLDGSPTIRGNRIIGNAVSTSPGNGGGIGVGLASMPLPRPNPLIEWNLIENNTAIGNGGGLSILHADAVVRNNVFRTNITDGDGGGIWVLFYDAQVLISNNEFWENQADDHGGGLHAADIGGSGIVTITSNLFVRNQANGSGTGDSGSGGAMLLHVISGAATNNTLVGNKGYGESACGGGGVLLDATPSDLDFRANIITFNDGCGVACKDFVTTALGANLLWQNLGGDLGTGSGICPNGWRSNQIFTDPLFCNLATDLYTVASNSPALSGAFPMGAFPNPGCGPSVPVRSVSWGRLKAMYR